MNPQQGPQDPLEERVRRALHDQRWQLPAAGDMVERVHTGAARRRRRRHQIGGALATVAIVAAGVGVAGYVAGPLGNAITTIAADNSAGQSRSGSRAEEQARPEAQTQPETEGSDAPGRQERPGSQAESEDRAIPNTLALASLPADFTTASFTAIGPERFWLLGATGRRAAVAWTEDGGATFGLIGRIDARVADDQTTGPGTVHDVRFADATNGWAYGGALFTTHDGGRSWSRTTDVPGQVHHLAAGDGQAYALARSGGEWSLWRSAAGTDTWDRLDVALHDPADLAVTGSSVVVSDRSGSRTYVQVSELGGDDFEQHTTPCVADLSGGTLSAGGGSLWLKCPTGTSAAFSFSTDDGRTWNEADVPGVAPSNTASVVAARTRDAAVVALPGEIRRADGLADGAAGTEPATRDVGDLGMPTFAGFTTPEVGYVLDRAGRLFRTTDGGDGWSQVQVN